MDFIREEKPVDDRTTHYTLTNGREYLVIDTGKPRVQTDDKIEGGFVVHKFINDEAVRFFNAPDKDGLMKLFECLARATCMESNRGTAKKEAV